jgi:ubiquinone/menaquinone biosynthesis C-methylase UbiE
MTTHETVPNHHAHFAPFKGAFGVVAAVSMIFGRGDDAQLAIELSSVGAGDVVVDVGSGPGAAARRAVRAGAVVIGVDPADVMLRTARLLSRGTVSYRKGAAESLPVDDVAAQIVWSIATVHHWRDVGASLREVRRALVPGGRFVAIEHKTGHGAHGHKSHGWTHEQAAALAARCEEHGFVDVSVGEHPEIRRPALSVTARNP